MLVNTQGEVMLSDFGIAVAAHNTQSLHTELAYGTTLYMAPEQFQGKPRPASDQYALAVVVYEWLCGSTPFDGATQAEIMNHHLSDAPPSLRTQIPTLPADIDAVVLKALSKAPIDRFENVQAFADAFSNAYQVALTTQLASSPATISPPPVPTTSIATMSTGTVPAPIATQTPIAIPQQKATPALLPVAGHASQLHQEKPSIDVFATIINLPFWLVEGVLKGPLLFSLPAVLIVPSILGWKFQSWWAFGIALICFLFLFNSGRSARKRSTAFLLGLLYAACWGGLFWLYQSDLLKALEWNITPPLTASSLPIAVALIAIIGMLFHTIGFNSYVKARRKKYASR
jgi:Protein kinase domain